MKTELTQSRLRELLHYDPAMGVFKWIVGRSGVKKPEAGGHDGQGYTRIKVDGWYYGAHRLAWLYMTGAFPSGQIDHMDGCRTNNVFANLRDVPRRVNSENQRRANSRSKTGLLGVWAPTRCCPHFVASIRVDGRQILLGKFSSAEAAHAAYVAAKRRLHAGCTI